MTAPSAPGPPDAPDALPPPRYINRGWWAFVAVAIVVIGAVFLLLRQGGPDDAAVATAPGFEDQTRTVDTRPFELVDPGNGSTTIPGSLYDRITSTTTSTTTTTTPTTTTTTLVPLPASHPDAVCNGFIDLIELARVARDEPDTLEADEVAALVADLARRLQQIGEPTYEPAVARLEEASARLGAASSDGELRATLQTMLGPDPRMDPVARHAQGACPEILAAI